MSKIALFLLFALVAIQLISAARIPREEPKVAEPGKVLEDLLNQAQNFIKTNFNEEQLKKLQDFGADLANKSKDLLTEAGKNLQQLGEKKE